MKANAAQIGAAIDRLSSDVRLFLLHGPDEAGALDYAERLHRAIGKDAERVDLDGAMLKGQPGRLADEAASLSLFGDKRFVRVTAMGEESLEAVNLLLDAPTAGNPVVAVAPGVKASGKLVKLALAAPGALVTACYVPEGPNAARLAAQIGRDHGVRLSGDAPARMFNAAGGDRAVLTREIEKLALYLDAAPDRPREASDAAIAAIAANIDEAGINDATDAVIDGQPTTLGPELARMDAANLGIPVLRALARRLIVLADMRAEVDNGASASIVVEQHRVFWKAQTATVRALQRWDAPAIAAALQRVRAAERMVIGGGGAPLVAMAHDMLAVARAAGRR